MSTTEEQLLAQIWERPDDRSVLAVYADWLVEQGDAERGQYMQLWLLKDPTPAQLRLRDWLWAEHQLAWLGPARPFVTSWSESAATPGFFAHVSCTAEKLVAGFDAIRALGPRLHVALERVWGGPAVKALGSLPLGKLYRLELYEVDEWLTDETLGLLGPALHGLRSLALHPVEWGATEHGWQRLLPHLGTLEQLDLGLGRNPSAWVDHLLASPLLSTLQRLSLPGWIAPEQRARVERAMAGRELAFRPERRKPFAPITQPVG